MFHDLVQGSVTQIRDVIEAKAHKLGINKQGQVQGDSNIDKMSIHSEPTQQHIALVPLADPVEPSHSYITRPPSYPAKPTIEHQGSFGEKMKDTLKQTSEILHKTETYANKPASKSKLDKVERSSLRFAKSKLDKGSLPGGQTDSYDQRDDNDAVAEQGEDSDSSSSGGESDSDGGSEESTEKEAEQVEQEEGDEAANNSSSEDSVLDDNEEQEEDDDEDVE